LRYADHESRASYTLKATEIEKTDKRRSRKEAPKARPPRFVPRRWMAGQWRSIAKRHPASECERAIPLKSPVVSATPLRGTAL